jgi:hypothetical protein
MSDRKSSAAPSSGAVMERVAGVANRIKQSPDGPLNRCLFYHPMGLCRFGDVLFVADYMHYTIRELHGVLGVHPLPAGSDDPAVLAAEFEASAVPLITAAIPPMIPELARVVAQYACSGGFVRTIAGQTGTSGSTDGLALGCALFSSPTAVAMDMTDPVAGPQLLMGEMSGAIRCLHLRTHQVSTLVKGLRDIKSNTDGPASKARILNARGLEVAPNGAVFVADEDGFIRRISAAKWPAAGGLPAERLVTTLIGEAGPNLQFARSSAQCFRAVLDTPLAMASHIPSAAAAAAAEYTSTGGATAADADADADADRDAGWLYVCCPDGVHAFDLTRGERKCFALGTPYRRPFGVAVTDDGARLIVVTEQAVCAVSTRSGAMTLLSGGNGDSDDQYTLGIALGCVLDKATRSVVMCDYDESLIVRLRGVDI